MGGRPAKPTKLKELLGNPGKRRLNDAEPRPPARAPKCPAWLPRAAKAKWRALAPELEALGLLTAVDGDALAGYCLAWSELLEATATLAAEGRTFTTATGYQAPHPAVAMQRSALTALKGFAALFGLDPASRARLKAPGAEPEVDAFEEFLRGAQLPN